MKIQGTYHYEIRDSGGLLKASGASKNFLTQAGMTYILGAAMSGQAQFSTWTLRAKNAAAAATPADTLSNRAWGDVGPAVAWLPVAGPYNILSNGASPATMVFSADGVIGGFYLSSGPLLLSVTELSSPQPVESGDTIHITYPLAVNEILEDE